MSSQVKKSGQCQLRDKKHQYFSIVSLPTDSVIVDHAVLSLAKKKLVLTQMTEQQIQKLKI
jgi:acyl CoA:acetate/3-ketoacid CoA transferase beta subunit